MPSFSPAFRKWFGASRVVDADGQPLVVYHGTDADVRVFSKANMIDAGFYFTDVREYAENYGANVVAAYLRLENPLLLTHTWFDTRYPTPARMQAEGHDGFIVTRAGVASMFVVFSAKQIKAVDNDGTWDANDPDIRSNPGPAFIRFEHKNGLGLMNRTGFDAMRLTDDEDFELTELLTYGLRQPVEVSRGAVFAFTPEGVQKNARLIKLLRKASITGVKKITLDPEAYRIVWQSDDGQVALVPASLGIGPGGREARLYEPA